MSDTPPDRLVAVKQHGRENDVAFLEMLEEEEEGNYFLDAEGNHVCRQTATTMSHHGQVAERYPKRRMLCVII